MDTYQLISIITQALVGFGVLVIFLKQRHLISNYEKYISIIDIDKLKKYDRWREEAYEIKTRHFLTTELTKVATEISNAGIADLEERYRARLQKQFDELERVAWNHIMEFEEEDQPRFINEVMPNCAPHLLPSLEDIRRQDKAKSDSRKEDE